MGREGAATQGSQGVEYGRLSGRLGLKAKVSQQAGQTIRPSQVLLRIVRRLCAAFGERSVHQHQPQLDLHSLFDQRGLNSRRGSSDVLHQFGSKGMRRTGRPGATVQPDGFGQSFGSVAYPPHAADRQTLGLRFGNCQRFAGHVAYNRLKISTFQE